MKSIFRPHGALPNAQPDQKAEQEEKQPARLFNAPANIRLWRAERQAPNYAGEITKLYREVFTPSQPKQTAEALFGRDEAIRQIAESIEEAQAHVILIGHRRIGKTSVLNVVAQAARQAGFLVARVTCTGDLVFPTFLRAIFDDLSADAAAAPAGHVLARQAGVERLSDLIDPETGDVHAAVTAFSRIATQRILVLVDDYHRIDDRTTKRQIVDLLAALTARNVTVSMVISQRRDGHEHAGFELDEDLSGVVTVSLEPVHDTDIADMLRAGGYKLGIRFEQDILESVVALCQGNPVHAQWMGLLIARRILRRYDDVATIEDVVAGAHETADKAGANACALIDRVLAARGDTADLETVLYLAARTPHHKDGSFTPDLVNREAAHLGISPYPTNKLHRMLGRLDVPGDALVEKLSGGNGVRYRFVDPLMPSIILLRNAARERPSGTDVLNAYLQHQALPLPKHEALLTDEFWRWLQFVLSPADAAIFRQWCEADPAGHDELRRQYRRAQDEETQAVLLQQVRDVIAAAAGNADQPTKAED